MSPESVNDGGQSVDGQGYGAGTMRKDRMARDKNSHYDLIETYRRHSIDWAELDRNYSAVLASGKVDQATIAASFQKFLSSPIDISVKNSNPSGRVTVGLLLLAVMRTDRIGLADLARLLKTSEATATGLLTDRSVADDRELPSMCRKLHTNFAVDEAELLQLLRRGLVRLQLHKQADQLLRAARKRL